MYHRLRLGKLRAGKLGLGIALIVILLCFCSCHKRTKADNSQQNTLTDANSLNELVKIDLPLGNVNYSLKKVELVNRMRLVPVFQRDGEINKAPPRYRLFGIEEHSIYHLLGLRNVDVLVAAENKPVYNPQGFKQLMYLIPQMGKLSIDVIRDDRPITFVYSIK